ncbi:MAG: carboxymethylenebutenolidase [Actinomycetota bacterium]|jgi:carboxymethylenebutenolidase|nr:carboxymethylenebutenolidase [Actinomycetota bacterium]
MRIQLPSGTPAEFAVPPDGVALRGLVLAPDVGGLRPLYDDMAARLAAEEGWAVAVVEPFPGRESWPVEDRLGARIDVGAMVADLVAAAAHLEAEADVRRVGVMGFCMGGMKAYRAAGTGRFDRAVSLYGIIRPPEQWSEPGHDPLDDLARPECCPVLAICGGADPYTPPDDIAALKAVGAHVVVRVYEEAGHGFVHDPSRPSYRPDDAADAWRWAIEFLA